MKLALTKSHMKSISPMRCLAVVAFAGIAAFSANATERTWQPQGGSTDISDPNNWGGALPGNGDYKIFGNLGGDYTVTIPAATAENPYQDYAGLLVNGLNDGQKVTFDATGTSWLEMADPGVAWYGSVALRVIAGDHIFNIENLNAANANDNFGFSLTDGKISFKRDDANGSRLVFEGGTFNNAFSPDGTASPHKNVFFHSNSAPAGSVVELAGGSVTFDQMEIRGKSADCEVLVSGGEHHVYDGIVINTDKGGNSTGSDAVLHVSGGSLTLESSCLWLGKDAGDKAVLRVDGTGLFEVGSGASTTYFPDGATYSGLLSIGGHGQFLTRKGIMFGHHGGTGEILVEEDGTFQCTDWFPIGEADNCTLAITVKDRGRFLASNAGIVQGTGRKLHMTVEDSATAEIKCGDMANNATAEFALDLNDNAVLKIGTADGNINFGNNSGGKIDFTMTGGTLESYSGGEANVVGFRGGPASTYTIAGGTITTKNMVVEGVQNDDVVERASYTNTVRMTGGTVNVRMNGNGDGLDIRGNDRNAMFLVEGGELNVGVQGGGMVRIGHLGAGNGYHSILRQTGGVMNLGATVNLCDSAADGEIELFGGVARVWTIRGHTWCDVRGNSNKATLYGNGGTIVPWQDNLTFFYTMSGVYVGEDGLTVDTKAYNNVLMRVKIENKDDAAGLFVKKGTGTLRVGLVETDSGARGDFVNRSLAGEQTYTRIDEGTVRLEDATNAAFGKNIIVKGGATLSLAGTAQTLTVDTLTLGDGTTAATLVVDAGDTVVVNDENGLDADAAVVDFSSATVNDEYPVFVCAGNVDIAAVDGIGIIPNSAHDCEWICSYDDGTDTTTFSIRVADAGTIGKIITYDNGSVTTNGEGRVARLIANESGSQYGELDLTSAASATVEAGSTLTLGGDLHIPAGGTLSKRGSGKLVVNGDNSAFSGSFASHGGTLEVSDVDALGKDPLSFPLVLGNGTFRYTGDEVTVNSSLKLAGDTAGKSVIIDNDGDMTFTGVEHVRGTFVKKGTGKLTFDLPGGTFYAGHDNVDGDYGINEGTLVFPESGDAPETKNGLCGFTIAEGTLRVQGAGMDKTVFNTDNTSILGTSYAAKAAPILEIEDARVNFGKGSRHGRFMLNYPDTAPVPEVRMTNAYLMANNAQWGGSTSPTGGRGPVFTLKDSVIFGDYNMTVGNAGFSSPEIYADNSRFETDGIGMVIAANYLTADFYGADAVLGSFNASDSGNNNAGRIWVQNHVKGTLKIRDGARIKTTRGIGFGFSSLDFEFDNGIFEIASHNNPEQRTRTSDWGNLNKGIVVKSGGMEIAIAEGSTHDFTFPVMGEGAVVKTGAGTFKLVSARAEGEKLLQYTGGTVVSNGTLVIDGSLVADGAKSFEVAEGAILDLNETTLEGATIAGAGVVTNGTLSVATIAYDEDALTTFSGVAFDGTLFVDFGMTGDESIDKDVAREGIVFAHYTGDAPAITRVKAVNTGITRATARVSFADGDIVVAVKQSGFEVRIR